MKSFLWRINQAFALYILLFSFVPPIQIGTIYRIFAVGCAFLWLVIAFMQQPSFLQGIVSKYTLLVFTLVVVLFLLNCFVSTLSLAFVNNLQMIIVMLVGFIAFYYSRYDKDFYQFAIALLLVVICIFCVTTIQGTIDNPYAARIANSEWLEDRFEGNENIGLYGFVYMCVLILPSLNYMRRNRLIQSKTLKVLTLVASVLFSVMVLLAGYVIAIICWTLAVLIPLYERLNARSKLLLLIIIVFVIIGFYREIISGIFSVARTLVGDNIVYIKKLDAFEAFFDSKTITGDLLGRTKNYQASLSNLIKYPIIGSYILGKKPEGGGHSWLIDNLVRYGILPTVLLVSLYWKYPRKVIDIDLKGNVLATTVLIIIIIFGIADPYPQEMGISLFFFMPFALMLERDKCQAIREKSVNFIAGRDLN